ncbi:MAG: glycosyltransferase family 2 protein [Gemmatimonadaceae bacterium]|nr:glycosyltransferase family 2 protein [Gemmatimonadaceae bacterium]
MLSVVIPAFNEAARLPATLRMTLDYFRSTGADFEVIVVDDGSSDDTAERVREISVHSSQVRLIRLPQNFGKGFAVRSGIINAEGQRVLFMDADGATPLTELAVLEAAMNETAAEIVIGSRSHLPGSETVVEARWFRHVAGRTFHQFVRLLGVSGISDTQCGFKLFSREAAIAIAVRMKMRGFSFDVEMLRIGRELGYSIREVPVNWTHMAGSKVNVVRDGMLMVADLIRIRQNSLRGAYQPGRISTPSIESPPVHAEARE